MADLMRCIGGDVYQRDWGWWDRAGDWNGPDFRTTGKYLRKSGMGQLIYAFLYTVDPYSADNIWGVCVFRKEFAAAGPHTLRITVLGQHGPKATDSTVAIDGFRVER